VRAASALGELRNALGAYRDELDDDAVGPVLVSGMLAQQLARLLAEGATPGAVVTGDVTRLATSSVLVHIIAGVPTPEDEDLVARADRAGVPVVLVQLWPQDEWTRPFVLTPFVVECRAGAGFPVPEIARQITHAAERPTALARSVPVLESTVAERAVAGSALRAAFLALRGGSGGTRPQITLEQLRMVGALRNLTSAGGESPQILGGVAASSIAAGFLFREIARSAQRVLPAPVANAAVAAAGTWLLGEAFRRYGDRLP
jgi:hypothetical protein